MRSIAVATLAVAALVCTAPRYADAALLLGSNLVENGDAESPSNPGGGAITITSWTSTLGGMTVVPYGTSGGFPASTDPGPVNEGLQFFAGGDGVALSAIVQNVSVADGATLIDAGTVSYSLSAYLGGYASQDDFSAFSVTFESAVHTSLGSATLTGPNSSVRADQTGLLPRGLTGSIPVGTRSLIFELDATRLEGSYDDGYADNLSFIATSTSTPVPPAQSVPEPLSLAVLGSGLIGLMGARRRRL